MSTKQTLADLFAEIICDRNELGDPTPTLVAGIADCLEEDWSVVFGPWLDSVEERVAV